MYITMRVNVHTLCVCVCVWGGGLCASTNACTVISNELQSASTNFYSQSCMKHQKLGRIRKLCENRAYVTGCGLV